MAKGFAWAMNSLW